MSARQPVTNREMLRMAAGIGLGAGQLCKRRQLSRNHSQPGWLSLGRALGGGSSLLLGELPVPGFPSAHPEPGCLISW